MTYALRAVLCACGLFLLANGVLKAQALRGRISFQMAASSIERSVGPGLHVDAKQPIVGGLSLVAGGGLSAFILEGHRTGTYSFTPEVGVNLVVPSRSKWANVIFGGGGYHVPFGAGAAASDGGPTIHLGVGRIRALRETTLFINLSPSAVIRSRTTAFFFALRTGVVF